MFNRGLKSRRHEPCSSPFPSRGLHILGGLGFVEVRQRGSHKQYRHTDGRGMTVPFPAGKDVSPILLRQIAKDIGMTIEEFISSR